MQTSLAKLTIPRLINIYHRKRLDKILDSARANSIIWITSPGGAGKTSLVSSYLVKKKVKTIWYQMDEGDADITSFFSYLTQAASADIKEATSLPSLSPEYLAGMNTFSRNYFRELFSLLPDSSVVVFDNYQDVSTESKIHQMLHVGFEEIPKNVNVVIVSRENPPAEYSRMQANEVIKHIKWDEIQLDLKETESICNLKIKNKKIEEKQLSKLHEQSQGWLAGLILLLENESIIGNDSEITTYDSQQKIFDYFAGEIMSKTDSDTQFLLHTTALLPKVTIENAIAISNLDNAEIILTDLYERNYFTVRHTGEITLFEYHPLFRKYLIEQGKHFFTRNELFSLKRYASKLLDKNGNTNDAIKLLLESKQWQEAVRLISIHAKDSVQNGKVKTLYSWLEQLPEDLITTTPWLMYWNGICIIAYDPKQARDYLAKAFYLFKEKNDTTGQLLSFCSIVDTHIYERAEMITLDHWLKEIEGLIDAVEDFQSTELGMKISCAMFMALIYRQPDHPDMTIWEKRACEIVLSDADPRMRLTIGNHLVLYFMWWVHDKSKTEVIVNALKPLTQSNKIQPMAMITWQMIEAGYHWVVTGSGESSISAQKGLKIAEENGVHLLDVYLLTHSVFSALCCRDNDSVEKYLSRMTPLIEIHRHMDSSWYYYLYGWAEIAKENYELAFHYSEQALEHSLKSGRPFMIANAHIEYGTLLYRKGDKKAARCHVNKALVIGEKMNFPIITHLAEFANLEFEIHEHGENANLDQIKKCLMLGKKAGELSIAWYSPKTLITFYALALKHELDKEYVIERIQKGELLPLEGMQIHFDWPYPIKIYTLGFFKIVIDGKELIFNGKAQKKVLELLKALIAYGGHQVNIEVLCEALWSDADGDAAYQAFTMTLKRLRQLLNNKEALVLNDAKLSLNIDHVWLDVWLFEKGIASNDKQAKDNATNLYQGEFLENEAEAEWMLPTRNRLRQKYFLHEMGVSQYRDKINYNLKIISDN